MRHTRNASSSLCPNVAFIPPCQADAMPKLTDELSGPLKMMQVCGKGGGGEKGSGHRRGHNGDGGGVMDVVV